MFTPLLITLLTNSRTVPYTRPRTTKKRTKKRLNLHIPERYRIHVQGNMPTSFQRKDTQKKIEWVVPHTHPEAKYEKPD